MHQSYRATKHAIVWNVSRLHKVNLKFTGLVRFKTTKRHSAQVLLQGEHKPQPRFLTLMNVSFEKQLVSQCSLQKPVCFVIFVELKMD